MKPALTLLAGLAAASLSAGWLYQVWLIRPRLSGTTLTTSWRWVLAALAAQGLALLAMTASGDLSGRTSNAWSDLAWYGVSILMLCPAIAVLGARRPGVRAWNWFILVPLVAVLGWPAVAQFVRGSIPAELHLELPTVIGFALVAVMGYGNYLGTKYRVCVGLVALAQLAVLATLTGAEPRYDRQLRFLACVTTCLAIAETMRRSQSVAGAQPLDRMWFAFRDTFGVVWALRVRERINQRALEESWPVSLTAGGFAWSEGVTAETRIEVESRIDHALRWLLRRFVDDAWVNSQLASVPQKPVARARFRLSRPQRGDQTQSTASAPLDT